MLRMGGGGMGLQFPVSLFSCLLFFRLFLALFFGLFLPFFPSFSSLFFGLFLALLSSIYPSGFI